MQLLSNLMGARRSRFPGDLKSASGLAVTLARSGGPS